MQRHAEGAAGNEQSPRLGDGLHAEKFLRGIHFHGTSELRRQHILDLEDIIWSCSASRYPGVLAQTRAYVHIDNGHIRVTTRQRQSNVWRTLACGYLNTQKNAYTARAAALRSRDTCVLLLARCTMALALSARSQDRLIRRPPS